ncbi:MAG TPA: hypothetical protein VHO25_07185, partial [Polyangiaceae bacterium]|nr:hypothetical protein [Polyangiaceae bacterium]
MLCAVLIGAIGCGDRVVTRKAEKARAEPTVAIPTPLISTVPSVYYEPPPLTRDEKIAAAKRLCATGECLPTNNEWESLLVSATKSEKAALGKICLDA